MSNSESSKSTGWAFLLGGFTFAAILTGSDPFAIPGSVISSILLAVGMSGLRRRYGDHASSFGRNILLLGVMGPILFGIAIASGNILYSSGSITNTHVEKGLWVLIFVAPAISLLGLTLFGLDALRSKPMPRLNWLPFVTGIWYPVAYSFLAGYLFTHDGKFPQQYYPALQLMFLMQFLALFAFGAVLLSDTTQETAPA